MQEISDKIGDHQYADIKVTCEDCGEDFTMRLERTGPNQIEIKNGCLGKRKGEYLFKCPPCFEYNPNFGPKVEIYSRVVGYLRPIGSWNDAKQEEFKRRKNYDWQSQREWITAKESKHVVGKIV